MSTLRTNAITDITGGNTTTVNGVLLSTGILTLDNRIINGSLDIWERNSSGATLGYVAADRWYNGFGGGTVTQSRQNFTVGTIIGQSNPRYFLRQTVSGQSSATHYATTSQAIESVRSYAGQTITILGWAKRGGGTGNMSIEGVQSFGSGGTVSDIVTGISPTTVTLTTAWEPFAVVMNVPSITGKLIGTNNNDFFGINFWTSSGTDYNARSNSLGIQSISVDLWGIHIKHGIHSVSAVDLYRPRDVGTELTLCQRYFEAGQTGTLFWVATTNATNTVNTPFATTKRGNPNITTATVIISTNMNNASFEYVTPYGFRYNCVGGGVGGANLQIVYWADAELV